MRQSEAKRCIDALIFGIQRLRSAAIEGLVGHEQPSETAMAALALAQPYIFGPKALLPFAIRMSDNMNAGKPLETLSFLNLVAFNRIEPSLSVAMIMGGLEADEVKRLDDLTALHMELVAGWEPEPMPA